MKNATRMLAISLVTVFLPCVSSQAESFAPLLDTTKASAYLKMGVRQIEPPTVSKVPVPAYPGAQLFSQVTIPASANGVFQENHILLLTSADAPEAVVSFYRQQLSDWSYHQQAKTDLFLKSGTQLYWGGGKKLLEGPRLEVLDLNKQHLDPKVIQLKKSFPEMKSVLKLTYEWQRTPHIDVDIEKLTAQCMEAEVGKLNKRVAPINQEAKDFVTNSATRTCDKISSSCSKDIASARCQKYARQY